ncbi:MAG: hypothetical protein WDW38_005075 [Sanguina aurantia]
MRRSGPHEALSDGNGLKFLYRTNAAFSLLGGPKAVSQDPSIATTLTSPGFAKRRASGAALPASGNRLSLGATPAEPVVLKLSELMAQTQASRMIGSAKETVSETVTTTTASQAANGLGPDLIPSPEEAAAALTALAESARLAVSAALGTEGAISTLAFSRSGNGSRTTMEDFYAVPKPVDLKPQAGPSGAAAKGSEKAGEGAAGGNEEDTKAVLALGQKPKWMRDVSRISSPLLRLHQGLYVPTSDIDLVVEHSSHGNIVRALHALANGISRKGIAKSVQVISKAKVPIIKFETIEHGGLAFDVSFDVANGPEAAGLVKQLTGLWPMMRPLILVLKLFLQQRELNEVYTGGVGSYALITMVTAFLQLHASRRPSSAPARRGKQGKAAQTEAVVAEGIEGSLGVLLIDFFRFYSRVLNLTDVGVSIASGGCCFGKGSKGWLNYERPFMLAVEDPADPTNDVCRSSFNIMRVKTAFEYAYQVMTTPCERDESLLCRILRMGPVLASRPAPSFNLLLQSSYYLAQPLPLPADPSNEAQGEAVEPMSKRQRRASQAAANASLAAGLREAGEVGERVDMDLEEGEAEEGLIDEGAGERDRLARHAARREKRHAPDAARQKAPKQGTQRQQEPATSQHSQPAPMQQQQAAHHPQAEQRQMQQEQQQLEQRAQQQQLQLQRQQQQQQHEQQQQRQQPNGRIQQQQQQPSMYPLSTTSRGTEGDFLRGRDGPNHDSPRSNQMPPHSQQSAGHGPAAMSAVRRAQSDQPMTVAAAMRMTMNSPAVSNAYRAPYQGGRQPSPFPAPAGQQHSQQQQPQQGRGSDQSVWGRIGQPPGNGQQQQQQHAQSAYRQPGGGQGGGHKYFQ